MLTAGGLVAAVAVPVGLIAWILARRRAEPLLPAWKPWRVPWGGFEVAAAFLVVAMFIPDIVLLGLSRADFYSQLYGPNFPPMPGPGVRMPPVEAAAAVAGAPISVVAHEAT